MDLEVADMLSEMWIKDVGPLEMIPFTSSVLSSKYGYSDIFRMYLMLGVGLGFNLEDSRYLFEGHTNKVSQVYEYWCYTRLYEALKGISAQYDDFVDSEKSWGMKIRRGAPISFLIPIEDEIVEVKLYYNQQTSRNSEIKSYSLPLRPDFTLLIDGCALIHLDSKYKLNLAETDDYVEDDDVFEVSCWRADIYKMHTYRDAIYMCYGSYVLYPGDDHVKRQGTIDRWYTKRILSESEKDDIPSVGAITLNPSIDSLEPFKKTLSDIIRLVHYAPKRRVLSQFLNSA